MILYQTEQFLVSPDQLVGNKFKDCFPNLKRPPYEFKLAVQSYYNSLCRLSKNNYTSKGKKTRDINLIFLAKDKIKFYDYVSRFILDGKGVIKGYAESEFPPELVEGDFFPIQVDKNTDLVNQIKAGDKVAFEIGEKMQVDTIKYIRVHEGVLIVEGEKYDLTEIAQKIEKVDRICFLK
jgi:hypothetical protein